MPKTSANAERGMDGVEKAAILLIALGPEKSAQIFKHLKEEEIEQLTLEIANTSSVSPQTKEQVLNEFYEVCLAQQYIAEGGITYAKELLEKALGEDKARDVIGKLTASLQVRPFEFIRKTDSTQLLNFIQDEHPQTIALILSYLPAAQASSVVSALPPEKQADVAKRIAMMDRTSPDVIKEMADSLKIVYTPLHGTGNLPVRRVLKELGFTQVQVVPEQELPDGDFPTVSYPNPEDPKAFALALELAKKTDADLVLATDPDADRLGIYAKDSKTGNYMPFTGNMSGLLIAEYELSTRKETGRLPKDGALVTTIVSSNMAEAIGKEYGIDVIEVLTGFKYIGQQILGFEQSGKGTYLFGFEESYGCLIGTHARDKDAIVATMALCEAAAYYKTQGKTLWDAMIDMYEKYGYYKDDIQAITLKGIEGLQKIQEIMETLRNETPSEIAGYKVLSARDYKKDTIKNMESGEMTKTGLPSSNVLYYDLSDEAWLCVRPSGTEPKVKFYYGVKGTSLEDADAKSAALGKQVVAMIQEML